MTRTYCLELPGSNTGSISNGPKGAKVFVSSSENEKGSQLKSFKILEAPRMAMTYAAENDI